MRQRASDALAEAGLGLGHDAQLAAAETAAGTGNGVLLKQWPVQDGEAETVMDGGKRTGCQMRGMLLGGVGDSLRQ